MGIGQDTTVEETVAVEGDTSPRARVRTRRRLRTSRTFDLIVLTLVGALLLAALAGAGAYTYQQLYSPEAFVKRYASLLSQGRAADALLVPGVSVSASSDGAQNTVPAESSDALLRRAALAPLENVETVSTEERDGHSFVTISYQAGEHEGQTTFEVEQDGWTGLAPAWRFSQSPLAVIDLTVRGSKSFSVNGFSIDKRQLSATGTDVDPLAAVPLLVFSPGLYSIYVDSAVSASPGVAVLSDTPGAEIPVDLQAQATDRFEEVVQERVEDFLETCADQEVLQPTGCPFGFFVDNRIASAPEWTIEEFPDVSLSPDGAEWTIRPSNGVAHLAVDVRSIFDGSITHIEEAVPFVLTGSVSILADDSASIQIDPAS